jgi:hypothetical protein
VRMSRQGLAVILAFLIMMTIGCTTPEEPPESETVVPDVLHVDLRQAYKRLEREGFQVSFGPRAYRLRSYATYKARKGLQMELQPAPHVADTAPDPGTPVPRGSMIVILDTECPDQAETCL